MADDPRVALDAACLRNWMLLSQDSLGRRRKEIDALNVFPVPDGDTGTNMYLTVEAAAVAAGEVSDPANRPSPVAEAIARGSLLGARGNSGVILSQLLRGFADVVGRVDTPAASTLQEALRRGADQAYEAVSRPVEGTVLTVARAAADAASTVTTDDLAAVATAAADSARAALARTPEQLPALAAAGVVDAGGKGLVVVLDALAEVLTGETRVEDLIPAAAVVAHEPMPQGEYHGPRYEVMYLLDGEDDAIPQLRSRLDALGDSLVVVGGGGLWNVHVHTDSIGESIEAGIEAGRPHRIAVTDLIEQQRHLPREITRVVVAVAHGPGVASLLEESGAAVVRTPPRGRPSTRDFVRAVTSSGAREALLLPSDSDSTPVAKAAAEFLRDDDIRVAVVPSRSIVQTLSAVAVHDAAAGFDDDVVTMARASSATRYGGVTVASKEAITTAGRCQIGDVLGLVDGDIVEIGDSVEAVTMRVIDRMCSSTSELVTLVTGSQGPPELVEAVEAHLRSALVDLEVVAGGQPYWPVIVGVE
ncbi:MAG: DAK2 domain-containing protein [Candidatus Nanopelagicales bacterium]|nr:DAK2 domain-containing protein [Candidatus Nanopelagicales bacterium]